MALNTSKCNYSTALRLEALNSSDTDNMMLHNHY